MIDAVLLTWAVAATGAAVYYARVARVRATMLANAGRVADWLVRRAVES